MKPVRIGNVIHHLKNRGKMGEEEDPLSLQQKKNIALPIQVATESN